MVECDGAPILVTSAAVVGKATKHLLVTLEGANRMLGITRIGAVADGRLAVCRVRSGPPIPPLDLGSESEMPDVSDAVFSVGYLRGVRGLGEAADFPFVFRGTVAAVSPSGHGPVAYVDGSFNPGMVGGPSLAPASGGLGVRVAGITLCRQPVETKGAGGVLSPVGEERDPEVDSSVTAVLGIKSVVDLVHAVG